jgi:hypothetical protein
LKLPRLKDWIQSTFHKVLYERTVHPNKISFSLPFPGRKINFKAENVTKKMPHVQPSRTTPNPLEDDKQVRFYFAFFFFFPTCFTSS